jgi:hypothetical protein
MMKNTANLENNNSCRKKEKQGTLSNYYRRNGNVKVSVNNYVVKFVLV